MRTVIYIAEKADKIEQMLEAQLSETDKKEVIDLIKSALSDGKGIADKDLKGAEIHSTTPKGIEGVR